MNSAKFQNFNLKPLRIKCLEYILKGQDVVCVLPYWIFEKSLIFHLLPNFLPAGNEVDNIHKDDFITFFSFAIWDSDLSPTISDRWRLRRSHKMMGKSEKIGKSQNRQYYFCQSFTGSYCDKGLINEIFHYIIKRSRVSFIYLSYFNFSTILAEVTCGSHSSLTKLRN